MKKMTIYFLSILFLVSISACSSKTNEETKSSNSEKTIISAQSSEISTPTSSASITKTESDLKIPEVYEDVRGNITNGIYTNEPFGFTMDLNQPDFTSTVNDQEGYRSNFENPGARADDDVLLVRTEDFSYSIWFYQSHLDSQDGVPETAKDILEYKLSSYSDSVSDITEKTIGGHTLTHAQVTSSEGVVTDMYASIVNGFYIRWEIRIKKDNDNPAYQKQLQNIIDSISFDWVQ